VPVGETFHTTTYGIPIGAPSQRPLPKSAFSLEEAINPIILVLYLSMGELEISRFRELSAGKMVICSAAAGVAVQLTAACFKLVLSLVVALRLFFMSCVLVHEIVKINNGVKNKAKFHLEGDVFIGINCDRQLQYFQREG
jgi:hypothetical protein